MNQLYKKNEYIVIPVENDFIVINTKKIFKEGHSHVRELGIARLLIDLAIARELPKNPKFADRLIRISTDKEYIEKLEEYKQEKYMTSKDFKNMMEDAQVCKRSHGAIKRVR